MKLLSQLERPGSKTILLAAMVMALLLLSLMVDLVPRFHLEDSAVFILTRYGEFIPGDRSWAYGLALGWVVRTARSLVSWPLCQIFLSWAAFALFAAAVGSATKLRYPWVVVLFLVGCLEPLGYYWSRSYMSDSPAQSVFAVLSAVLVSRVSPSWRFLLLLILGFALLSLRVVYYFPVVAALAVALAFRYFEFRTSRRQSGALLRFRDDFAARAWGTALVALVLANLGYAVANTSMTRGKVLSTNIGDMEFLAGALSPLMRDQLEGTPLTAGERASLPPLTYAGRLAQTFGSHGLVHTIRGHFHSTEEARPIMQRLVANSIRQHPIALAQLVLRQWSDYLNPILVLRSQARGSLSGAVMARGTPVVLSDTVIRIFGTWKISPTPSRNLPTIPSPSLLYLETAGGVWSLILSWYATFGILVVPFIPRRSGRRFLIFANSFSFCYMAMIAFAANHLVTRYLLPLDVPLLYFIALCLPDRAKYLQTLPARTSRPNGPACVAPPDRIQPQSA